MPNTYDFDAHVTAFHFFARPRTWLDGLKEREDARRPSDIELPPGWTWERVEAERVMWGLADNMIPEACGSGVVAWGTIGFRRSQNALRSAS